MNVQTKVSIGLPVYNGQKFLAQTLDSLLAQTHDNFELIISDNASTDNTRAIALAYAASDRRVRYHRQSSNIGASANFNAAYKLSSGKYFKWTAADDLIKPTFLERCVQSLDTDSQAVLAYPRAKIIDETNAVTRAGAFNYSNTDLATDDIRERFKQMFLYVPYYPIFGLIRSSALKRTSLLGQHLAADYCLLIQLALCGPFAEVPEHLMNIRIHDGCYGRQTGDILRSGGVEGAQQAKWWNPSFKGRFCASYWKRLTEHTLAIFHCRASLAEKFAMLAFLCKVANWWRGHLLREAMAAVKYTATDRGSLTPVQSSPRNAETVASQMEQQ